MAFRVLLAEDNLGDVRMVRQAVHTSLVSTDLIVAFDGEEALRQLETAQFDLVIVDLNLPKCDGLALMQRFGDPELSGAPPFVIFSGSSRQFDRELALLLGAKEYIIKPTDLQEYMQAVKDIVEAYGDQFTEENIPGA